VGEPSSPKAEFAMSVVGPLTSLALAACFWGLRRLLGPGETPGTAVTLYLAFVNLLLGVFNLVPGFPLDGGRVLRSIIWGTTRDFRRATQVATFVGQGFGFLLIGWGMVQLLAGDYLHGMWTIFLGWFLNISAEAARHAETMGYRAPLGSIRAGTNLSDALHTLASQGIDEVWVLDEDGHVVGLLRRASDGARARDQYRAPSRAA
jgi:hypothetical protein